jgi:hypothetical protein
MTRVRAILRWVMSNLILIVGIAVAILGYALVSSKSGISRLAVALIASTVGALVASLSALLWLNRRQQVFKRSPVDVTPDDRRLPIVHKLLEAMCEENASILDLDPVLVRAAVFRPKDGALEVIPGFSHNMPSEEEQQIRIAIGQGCAGQAFAENRPHIAVLDDPRDDASISDARQLIRVSERLRWIVSVPVGKRDTPTLVLNSDGLDQKRPPDRLVQCVPTMLKWGFLLQDILNEEAVGT